MKMALIAKHIKHELIKETIKTLSDEKKTGGNNKKRRISY